MTTPDPMKIQVTGLSEGRHAYNFTRQAGELLSRPEFPGEIRVDATLEKAGRQMLLSAKISTSGRFTCDRCLDPFDLPLAPSYKMYYVMEGENAAGMDPAEVQVIPSGVPTIDITDDVRQTLELAIPLKLLCRADCRGLCPHCGKNLNTATCTCSAQTEDGRWDTLKILKTKST